MDIYVLGPTKVVTPDGVLGAGELGGVKPRQILEILAISAGTPVSKDLLADLLWEGRPPRGYLGTLESYVCVLRRCLGLEGGRGAGVMTVRQGYLLDPEKHSVDLTRFRALSHGVHADAPDPAADLARLEQALELVHGELLSDENYAAWAIEERSRFRTELVTAATAAAAQALALGRAGDACHWADTALTHDRFAEHAWRTLMRAMEATGRRAEALRAYSEVRNVLADELGTDPSRETTALYLELLQGDASASAGAADSARVEIQLLVGLLRQVVSSVPEVEVPRGDRALMQVAADLLAVS